MRRRALASRSVPRALVLAILVSAVLSTGFVPIRSAEPVQAGTAESMESALLGWINSARKARGLPALRASSALASLAGERVAVLAAKKQLSHTLPGCLSCQLTDRGIKWALSGEVLASNTFTWGLVSARVVFDGWKASPTHWNILMGTRMDTIGIGVAKASNGATYAGAILIDDPGYAGVAPKPATPAKKAPTPVVTPIPAAPESIVVPSGRAWLMPQ